MPTARHLLIAVPRATARLAARAPLRLAVLALLALIATWPLLATAPALNQFRDAHVLSHYETAAAMSVWKHGELPLWDRSYCGGMYLLGTPQARFVSPTFLLTLIFGEARGEALAAFVMILLGLEGAYRYARSRGASSLGALLGAPVFGLSGVFAAVPVLGWINFYGFALVPWIALGVRRALHGEVRGVAIAAVAVAWCVGFGGTYAAPMAALWCAFETIEALVAAGSARRAIAIAGRALLVASLAAGLAALRLWPVLETLRDAPRVIGGAPGSTPRELAAMLFHGIVPGSGELANAGTYFVGALALPAVALGCARRRSLPLVAFGVIWAWLAAGYGVKPSLFDMLRALPLYGTLRYPERFLILLALAASALAARGVTSALALARSRGPGRRAGAIAFAVAGLALVIGVGPMIAQYPVAAAHRELSAPPVAQDRPFRQARGTRWALAYYAPMERGSLSCWDAYPVPQSPLLRGDRPSEEWLEDPAAGTLVTRASSPNGIDLDVDLARPARVAINQNWHAGWRANVGDVRAERGLLVVDVPAGHHALSLRFRPRSALGGAAVSLVALLAIGWLVRRPGAGARAAILASLAPPLALAASLLLVREARAQRPPPETPNGEPVVIDQPGEEATRLDARFDAGVTLEAASLRPSAPRAGETVTLELDWRREARIGRGLGIFMHIEPSSGDTLNGDHVLLSQSILFEDAPPGKTLRDQVTLSLPPDAAGKSWKVWVGLWRALGDGQRVRVRAPGQATVEDDRVQVASFSVP